MEADRQQHWIVDRLEHVTVVLRDYEPERDSGIKPVAGTIHNGGLNSSGGT